MLQRIYVEYNPEIEITCSTPLSAPPLRMADFPNTPESIAWRKTAIDTALGNALDENCSRGNIPLDIVIGNMYVLKNVTRILRVMPSSEMPGYLYIEFEQHVYA